MSYRGPSLWSNILKFDKKQTKSFSLFKSEVKSRLLNFDNEKEFL